MSSRTPHPTRPTARRTAIAIATLTLAAVSAAALAGGPPQRPRRFAILGSPAGGTSWNQDVQQTLLSTGYFASCSNDGSPCATNDDCDGGTCLSTACSLNSATCDPTATRFCQNNPGTPCTANGDCPTGDSCTPVCPSNACLRFCTNNPGTPCTSNTNCPAGDTCATGTCPVLGNSCTSSAQCETNTCVGRLDRILTTSTVPPLATLLSYESVLVFTDARITNNATFGTSLARYVEQRRGVVLATFANASIPIGGDFATNLYWVINPCPAGTTCQAQGVPAMLGATPDPQNPILGATPLLPPVTSFNGGTKSYQSTGTLRPGSKRIADWSTGRPLVAERLVRGTRRVDVNFYPPSDRVRADFWVSTSDGAQLLANALLYAVCRSGPDTDGDSVFNDCDNCVATQNTTQTDADADALGDACDPCTDRDGDGFGDPGFPNGACGTDNCPAIVNVTQANRDGDTLGDACDTCPDDPLNDSDMDGICGNLDNCPTVSNAAQLDGDGDGFGNSCDNCATVYNRSQVNTDGDAFGDSCDNCPLIPGSQTDTDSDGVGNPCDNCPFDFNPQQNNVCNLQLFFAVPTVIEWDATDFEQYNLFRGDLEVLALGGGYTQEPGSNPLAAQSCGIQNPGWADPVVPLPGRVAFYLATGIAGGEESSLGGSSDGAERVNTGTCP